LDNSVLVSLVVSDEDPTYSEQVLQSAQSGARLMAPGLCMCEFGNAMLTCVRRKRMTIGQAWKAFERLEELPIEFGVGISFHELAAIHALADTSGLSFYDAVYLMLAISKNARLATLDMPLLAAAKKQGVEAFE
jgi:predicted nucleic acid-binding protein